MSRPGGVVHVGAGSGPDLVAPLHQPKNVDVLHGQVLGQILHVGAVLRVLPELELSAGHLQGRFKRNQFLTCEREKHNLSAKRVFHACK